MTYWILGTVILTGVALWFVFKHWGVGSYLSRANPRRQGTAVWEDRGPTPLGDQGYTPQGMTWANGKILFANSWKNTRSRVYEIDPATMKVLRTFDMPEGAVHTSGLAWDGGRLWGVDYVSNRVYCIDLEPSLSEGKVRLIGSFDSTLRGTSACCIVPWDGERLLAVSDFMRSKKTLIIRMEEALRKGSAAGAIAFEYLNEGFSQGLEFAEGYLYESENKIGTNIINKIDLARLRETRSSREATAVQYPAPGEGVEDLAWDGSGMWTSDEKVFRFFRGTFR